MKILTFRATAAVISAFAMLSLAAPASAQQNRRRLRRRPRRRARSAAGAGRLRCPAAPRSGASRRRQPFRPPAADATASAGRARGQAAEGGRRRTARIVAVVDVHVGRHAGQGGDDRSRVRLAGDLDHLPCQDDRAVLAAQAARGARQDRRSAVAGRSAVRARRQGQRAVVIAGGRDARGAAVGGHFAATPASRSAPPRALPRSCAPKRGGPARHGAARDDRRDLAVRRAVRHRLGHHEQLHRHLEIADDQSRRRRARHRRSAARHRASGWPRRSRP